MCLHERIVSKKKKSLNKIHIYQDETKIFFFLYILFYILKQRKKKKKKSRDIKFVHL